MSEFLRKMKIKAALTGLLVCVVADTIQTRITDAQMMKVDGRFMIATEYRPLMFF